MLLFEDDLSREIKNLLNGDDNLRIAVAFIGNGASKLINPMAKNVKIICNLTMGATNPAEVKKLIVRFGKDNIRQIDNLHAKLYISSEYAIVGSANMSNNGLGTQPNALREAGYKFKLDQPSGSLDWFDKDLWEKARMITDRDLEDAAKNYPPVIEATEIPQPEIPRQPLSKLFVENLASTDYIFAFYHESGGTLTQEDEDAIHRECGNETDFFEEGSYNTQIDANAHRDKISKILQLPPNGKIAFCINTLRTRLPRRRKFMKEESFVAIIKDVVVFKCSSGKFEVISLYEECENYPIEIDQKSTDILSSAYVNSQNHPLFYNFINTLLQHQNGFCTIGDLKQSL